MSSPARHHADGGVKLLPDSGLAGAIAQVQANKGFKRMKLFAIRSLAEFCSPPNNRYQDNALSALEAGVIPTLTHFLIENPTDEDACMLVAKILWGMTDSLKAGEKASPAMKEKFAARPGSGIDALLVIVAGVFKDEQTLQLALEAVESALQLSLPVDFVKVTEALLLSIKSVLNPKPKTSLQQMKALAAVGERQNAASAQVMWREGGLAKVLEVCARAKPSEKDTVPMIEAALKALQGFASTPDAATKSNSADQLECIMALMDTYKGRRTISERGSAVMASLMGPQQLTSCMASLSSAGSDPAKRKAALSMLSCMSYIDACAEQIAKAGSLPPLCDAMLRTADEIAAGRKDPSLMGGLTGACKLIGTLAADPRYHAEIVKCDGLKAVMGTLTKVAKDRKAAEATFLALTPMSTDAGQAARILSEGHIRTILSVINDNADDPGFAEAVFPFIRSISSAVAATHNPAYVSQLLETLPRVMKASKASQSGADCVFALTNLIPEIEGVATLKASPGFLDSIIDSISGRLDDPEVARTGALLISDLVRLPDGASALSGGKAVDCLLSIMIKQPDDAKTCQLCVSALESIATPQSVARILSGLESSLGPKSRNSPDAALQTLAAVSGLCQVSQLSGAFEAQNIAGSILQAIEAWITGTHFPKQQILVKTATQCLLSLKKCASADTSLHPTITQVVDMCMLAQVKNIMDKHQEQLDNNGLDLLRLGGELVQLGRFKDVATEAAAITESVLRVMKKHGDARAMQVVCINLLEKIAALPEGPSILSQGGALKAVLAYMLKVSMYEDVVLAGLRLLHACLKFDPSVADVLRRNGVDKVLRSASRVHGKSKAVSAYVGPLLVALTPETDLEGSLTENLRIVQRGGLESDVSMILTGMKPLREMTMAQGGARCATRLDAGKTYAQAINTCAAVRKRAKKPPADLCPALAETAIAMKNLTCYKGGCLGLLKYGGLQAATICLEELSTATEKTSLITDGMEAAAHVICRLGRSERRIEGDVTMKHNAFRQCYRILKDEADPQLFGALAVAAATIRSPTVCELAEFRPFLDALISGLKKGDSLHKARCLTALRALLDPPPLKKAVDAMLQHECIEALLQVIDDSPEDPELFEEAQACLLALAKASSPDHPAVKKAGSLAVAVCTRVIRRSMRNPEACTSSIRIAHQFAKRMPKEALGTSGIAAAVEEVMLQHPDNVELQDAVSGLVGCLGADTLIRSLMSQIMDLAQKAASSSPPSGWERPLERLCGNLCVYLSGEVQDPKIALQSTDKCLDALAQVIAKTNNVSAMASAARVGRRLVDKFRAEPASAFGAKAAQPHLMPRLAKKILEGDTSSKPCQNKKLLCNAFKMFAGALDNPETRSAALIELTPLLPKAQDLLTENEGNPEVVAAILDFLALAAKDEEGARKLASSAAMTKRKKRVEDLLNEVTSLMSRHRGSFPIMAGGASLIKNLIRNGKPRPACLKDKKFLASLENTCDGSAEGVAAYIGIMAALGEVESSNVSMCLKRAFDKWNRVHGDPRYTASQRALASAALVAMIGEFADMGKLDELKKANAADVLAQIQEECRDNLPVAVEAARVGRKLAKDSDCSMKLLSQNADIYLEDCLANVEDHPAVSRSLLGLLGDICKREGNGRMLAATPQYKDFLSKMMEAVSCNKPGCDELQAELKKLSDLVDSDTPENLTLQKLYGKWTARHTAGESLDLTEAPTVAQHFDFLCTYTEEYSKTVHKNTKAELATEFQYGCQCFQLLHGSENNNKLCQDHGEPKVLIAAIKRQQNEMIKQAAILAARDACQWKSMATAFAGAPEAALIVAQCLLQGDKGISVNAEVTAEVKEEMLIGRLVLAERIAQNRAYFNNTDAMLALIQLWDGFDGGKYTTMLLRHVFRTMRQIVSDHWLPLIFKHDIPRRLLDVVNDPNTDMELLPDVLFLIGTLAVVPQIKNTIGELGGIEMLLNLLRRCLKKADTDKAARETSARVQTNACLALSNLTIAHNANVAHFTQAKGPDLNLEVMRKSLEGTLMFDVVNGASILMCNTCFKRDDMKELYGAKKAPSVIMETIKMYKGGSDPSAVRCLTSMFKAMGNLALYTPNVSEFLNHGIEQTLVHFYSHCEVLPDTLIETSLRTVSNLVMENTETAMKRFSVIIQPLLTMLKGGKHRSVSMVSMCFETIGCLCRLPDNAKLFAANQGIPTVLEIVNNENDEALYDSGIYVLGIQTTYPTSVATLVQHGIFDFLVSLFEQQCAKGSVEGSLESELGGFMNTELMVSSLRCLRRLLCAGNYSDPFLQAGGVKTLCAIAAKTQDHPMVHMEIYRNLIRLLVSFPPPPPPEPAPHRGGEWDAEVVDEGVLPITARMDRPPEPRSWDRIGLTVPMVCDLIHSISEVLAREESAKQTRLFRCGYGLLAYFACEKIEGVVESFYNSNVPLLTVTVLGMFENDKDFVAMAKMVIANVAYSSDPAMYSLMRKVKELRGSLETACQSLPRTQKRLRDDLTLTYKLLEEKSLDTTRFADAQNWDFPLELTQWDKDTYPNGVQDLPQDMREEIRAGGKFKIVIDEKTREIFHWKSSYDMMALQWRIDPKEGPFTHHVMISRVKMIAKGCPTALFKKAVQASGVIKLSEASCCVLSTTPGSDLPEGAELNIICGSKRARDRFVALMTEWRDAATFGF